MPTRRSFTHRRNPPPGSDSTSSQPVVRKTSKILVDIQIAQVRRSAGARPMTRSSGTSSRRVTETSTADPAGTTSQRRTRTSSANRVRSRQSKILMPSHVHPNERLQIHPEPHLGDLAENTSLPLKNQVQCQGTVITRRTPTGRAYAGIAVTGGQTSAESVDITGVASVPISIQVPRRTTRSGASPISYAQYAAGDRHHHQTVDHPSDGDPALATAHQIQIAREAPGGSC